MWWICSEKREVNYETRNLIQAGQRTVAPGMRRLAGSRKEGCLVDVSVFFRQQRRLFRKGHILRLTKDPG